jgi:hypothetical protein
MIKAPGFQEVEELRYYSAAGFGKVAIIIVLNVSHATYCQAIMQLRVIKVVA